MRCWEKATVVERVSSGPSVLDYNLIAECLNGELQLKANYRKRRFASAEKSMDEKSFLRNLG
jgi:hypothetical protein